MAETQPKRGVLQISAQSHERNPVPPPDLSKTPVRGISDSRSGDEPVPGRLASDGSRSGEGFLKLFDGAPGPDSHARVPTEHIPRSEDERSAWACS